MIREKKIGWFQKTASGAVKSVNVRLGSGRVKGYDGLHRKARWEPRNRLMGWPEAGSRSRRAEVCLQG